MVCETCWSIATNRAFGHGGCAADYYHDVLKEREDVCEEGLRARTKGLVAKTDLDFTAIDRALEEAGFEPEKEISYGKVPTLVVVDEVKPVTDEVWVALEDEFLSDNGAK